MSNNTIKIDESEHIIGDCDCDFCWTGYPKKCECGGLIHAEFIDEGCNGDVSIAYQCDKCLCTIDPDWE